MTRAVITSLAILVAVGLGGCDELNARSSIQKGNAAYGEQDYDKAIRLFEEAIRLAPDLDVGYHNLGIAYSRKFSAGVETPENKAIAEKATANLAKWLEKHPKDAKIRKLLTGLWIDSGDYPKALAYWTKEHQDNPQARDVIQLIAGIHLKSGDWRTAIEWYRKDVEAATDGPGKVTAYQSIANLAFSKLWNSRDKVFGEERTEIAEIGLEAAGLALEIDPNNLPLTSISAGLWNNRATAHGPFWAATLDRSEAQVFQQRASVLREEAKKNAPPTPAPGATGNGP
jgi:tetratricopeptide (TPR) repeat protein